MKTEDMHNDEGILTGFSISNFFLSRHTVPKIVGSIPGAQIVRKQRRFVVGAPDDFCEFVVDGKTFLAIEPFGDNTEFWVVAAPPEADCPQIEKVRAAFAEHRVLFGLYAG